MVPQPPEGAVAGELRPAARLPIDGSLFGLLVESVRDYAIFALDAEGIVRTWNAGAQRFKGYEAHEIIGRHFSTFYPPEDIAADKPGWELRVATAEGRVEDQGWRLRKDGTRFWANVVITALRDAEGQLVGFAKVTRDLTERRAAEQQALADATRVAAAEAANRAKSEFLASMSHELRTPLNAIGGYAELLAMELRGPLTETQRSDLDRIQASQRHLLRIINDLLNYSRIEAGQVTYELAPMSLAASAAAVLEMAQPLALLKAIALTADLPGELSVHADRTKVEQIVLNLLSNAIKFTPSSGQVVVHGEARGDRVALCVTDTGPGIPADQRQAIFEPFVQLGRTLTTGHEGPGLGLAISRDLARAMGGELTVDAGPDGRGARFALVLPAVVSAARGA
jgi:PAS domain S-box-containing protein